MGVFFRRPSAARVLFCALGFVLCLALPCHGATLEEVEKTAKAGALAGHNAWMLTSSALVLFMTVPGLALFYGGLVRKKNVLSVMMQCLFLMALMTVLWALYGYSLAFGGTFPIWETASICS